MVDLIAKKQEGKSLTKDEITYIIDGYTKDNIPDYQLSAWLMAIYFKGMTEEETADLTMAIVQSGDKIDLSAIKGIKVDKHSTGGVGDTTTLVLAPLVAAAGVPVAKMSGRGLGHTGGTIDKLESFTGFNVELTAKQFVDRVNSYHLAVIGQSGNLTPADKKLYSLRDVTGTVNSIPLIASSIMSKKIAAGADGIVLDVKTGSGAFMKTTEDAFLLAKTMVAIGNKVNRHTIAIITNMDQPLSKAIGNSLEVKEAIRTLKGQGTKELEQLCILLASHMLVIAKKADNVEQANQILYEIMDSGKAIATFKNLIKGQGGNPDWVDDPSLFPAASKQIAIKALRDGYVSEIDAEEVGVAAMLLGAGREKKDSIIDHAVGIELEVKVGDEVKEGDLMATLYVNEEGRLNEVIDKLKQSIKINSNPVITKPLIYGIVTADEIITY